MTNIPSTIIISSATTGVMDVTRIVVVGDNVGLGVGVVGDHVGLGVGIMQVVCLVYVYGVYDIDTCTVLLKLINVVSVLSVVSDNIHELYCMLLRNFVSSGNTGTESVTFFDEI